MGSPEKLFISWEDIQDHMGILSARLAKERQWEKIVCITRGGLAPAALLSHFLGIKHVDTVCFSSYRDGVNVQGGLEVIKEIHSQDPNIILIDDLVDTGNTFIKAREMLPNAYKACLYAKPKGIQYVDAYYKEVAQERWIVFPWESEGEIAK